MSKRHLRVATLWNDTVSSEVHVNPGQSVTVGENPSSTLMLPPVAALTSDQITLINGGKDGFTLNVSAVSGASGGKLVQGDRTRSFDEFKGESSIALGDNDWGMIDLGEVAVFFHVLDAPGKIGGAGGSLETSMLATFLLGLTAHIALLLAAFLSYEGIATLQKLDVTNRFVQIVADQDEDVEELPELMEEEELEETSKKAGGEEGKFGEEDKEEETKLPKRDGDLVEKVDVKNLGANSAINDLKNGNLSSLFSSTDEFSDRMNVAMAGAGDTLVVGHGFGGMGFRGQGSGGGGFGAGAIGGLGSVHTGAGRGVSGKLGGRRQKRRAKMKRGVPQSSAFCKKSDITKRVGAKQRSITRCYEKALMSNPELSGKVTVQWTVALDGRVKRSNTRIAASTLGNAKVEGCMIRVVNRLKFSKPEGGECVIRFPFVFNSAL
ncbi:MAG: AgmX/PglI C-terminal domain-containing protein [Bradymonadia bacterium]